MVIFKKILFIFLFFSVFAVFAQKLPSESEKLIDEVINAYMQKHEVPGLAIAVVDNSKVASFYYGNENLSQKKPVTARTIFEIGSLSSIMTSLLVAQEVDFAKMNLDTSIRQYISTLPENYNDVTVKDLATHMAGLPFLPAKKIQNKQDLQNYLQTECSDPEAEEEWQYSHLGYGLLGEALETETGKDFAKLYYRHIALPLGMHNIAIEVVDRWEHHFAQGYDKDNHTVTHKKDELFSAATGLKILAGDMQNFLIAAVGLRSISDRVLYPMRMTQAAYVNLGDRKQGLGWEIHTLNKGTIPSLRAALNESIMRKKSIKEIYDSPLFNGKNLFDKFGQTNGFNAYIAVIPAKKSGIMILQNKNLKHEAIKKLGREILFKLTNMIENSANNTMINKT